MSERETLAEELRRVRESVPPGAQANPLPEPRPVAEPHRLNPPTPPSPEAAPPRPDNSALNAAWEVTRPAASAGGPRQLLARGLVRLLRRVLGAQETFNAHQVQFDNALLEYVDARLALTHRHYDRVLGLHHVHMEEIDTRHLMLQEELVAHVHDLVRRIDLVLAESEKGRASLEHGLRDVRRRLVLVEERLSPR